MRTRALSLNTETLRNLQNWELKLVAGGVAHVHWAPATGETQCGCTHPDDLVEMQFGMVVGGMVVQMLPPYP